MNNLYCFLLSFDCAKHTKHEKHVPRNILSKQVSLMSTGKPKVCSVMYRVLESLSPSIEVQEDFTFFSRELEPELFQSSVGTSPILFPLPDSSHLHEQVCTLLLNCYYIAITYSPAQLPVTKCKYLPYWLPVTHKLFAYRFQRKIICIY